MQIGSSRVAIVGLYRSGSSALAGVLQVLGLDLGDAAVAPYLEDETLASQLRRWWDEPNLVTSTGHLERQQFLAEWMKGQESMGSRMIGAKHPLLSLCIDDVKEGWGGDTRILWSHRDLESSISSLRRMDWGWPKVERIQRTLWKALEKAEWGGGVRKVSYERLLESPESVIESLIDELSLSPTKLQRESACKVITTFRKRPAQQAIGRHIEIGSNKPPKIVATMLSGNSEQLVADAVKATIGYVDEFLLIDTGITDDTKRIVQSIAGSKFIGLDYQWTNDFSEARNFALSAAAQRGADWAMTVDSDERFVFTEAFNRQQLDDVLNSKAEVEAWMMCVVGGEYSKERLIRIPSRLWWKGRTHETLVGSGRSIRRDFRFGYFWEAPKTAEAFQFKLNRDLEALLLETERVPHDPRWWYYLGQTYEGMKKLEKAIESFLKCANLDGWAGESASAYFRAGMCMKELARFRDAETLAATGLTRAPKSAELLWLAGYCAYQLGAMQRAVDWCELAVQCGEYLGTLLGDSRSQLTFRHVPALFEAPFDVLRFAFHRIGDHEKHEAAEKHFYRAKRMRETEMMVPRK